MSDWFKPHASFHDGTWFNSYACGPDTEEFAKKMRADGYILMAERVKQILDMKRVINEPEVSCPTQSGT
jgi:hypothetical protein